uniref:Uncharacterized protein n=1 Tax=Rhizophora mucronata TaxID=61149 RepID=A0A2P2J940_RHIMU
MATALSLNPPLFPFLPSSASPKSPRIALQTTASTTTRSNSQSGSGNSGPILRRQLLKGLTLSPLTLIIKQPPSSLAREVEVGSYLPPSPIDPSFVLFQATSKDTPALRAGKY